MSGQMSYKKIGDLFYCVKNVETGQSNRNSFGLAKQNSIGKGFANMFSTYDTASNALTKSPLANAKYAFPPQRERKF